MSAADIRHMLSRAQIADYPARSWLYRQDEPAHQFFLLEAGLVRLGQLSVNGDDILVRYVPPGDVFGYFALAVEAPNIVSAQAIKPSRVAVWERDTAKQLLTEIPRAAVNLLNVAVADVVYFHERSRRLVVDPVGTRVRSAVGELVQTIGIKSGHGKGVALDIGQREVAELAGTTIFSVNRELRKMEADGVVHASRGRIVVLKPGELLGG
jgi:CRP-like cAMP-binding protein